ncbi:MAG: guanine deaminase [Pseudomonadales bacterium]|jgi:guanine deaminase|nr:guanine deaminase [Pseudomonadales bacterium]
MAATLLRGSILDFPDATPPARAVTAAHARFHEDGVLALEDGRVAGLLETPAARAAGWDVDGAVDHRGRLIVPGFVDAHVHFPQVDMIGAWGEQLMGWLERHTFPAEARHADRSFSERQAGFFLDALLAHGTTTAVCYATVHAHSADALFAAAERRRMRLVAGKVLMDRNAPPELLDTARSGAADSEALIDRWHGRGRLGYAVTPRFAPTSTPAQLEAAAELCRAHPGVLMQTHLSENEGEIGWVRELFPERRDYTDVYHHYGLLGPHALLGHGIHLSDAELSVLAGTGSHVVFCPSSNLFLGSGLLDLDRLDAAGVDVALATDVGAGTSLSMLATAAAGYEVLQLRGQRFDPFRALYQLTLGNARSLGMAASIGNFETGREADLAVLDPQATTLLARRTADCEALADRLFALMVFGDDRVVAETRVLGEVAMGHDLAGARAEGT